MTKKNTVRPAAAEPAAEAANSTATVPQPAAVTVEDAVPAEADAAITGPAKPEKIKGQKAKDKSKKKKDKKKKNKEAVMIRFEREQLGLIDARADALGLSRAAWVRMIVAQALAQA